ncbi:MAG: 5'-methylthioadenosine/S-adenosylhomocysteine nucleosidase [Synergistaceae bacterium]|nr:5'-methylthioadenosine/S-adenosylhomocysteine nucleosidase [Synergistaceae bacterium]
MKVNLQTASTKLKVFLLNGRDAFLYFLKRSTIPAKFHFSERNVIILKKTAMILLLLLLAASCAESLPVYESGLPPILVQGAMNVETDRLISALDDPKPYTIGHWNYTAGTIDGYPVVVSVMRCGTVNATAATVLAIETFKPCAVIQQGTAGAHDPDLRRGDIVIASDCFNVGAWKSSPSSEDEGVDYRAIELLSVNFYDEYDSVSQDTAFLPSDKKLTDLAFSLKEKHKGGKVVSGRIATSNTWENRIDRVKFLHEKFDSSCEEMECFAAASICRIYGVPFLGVRIISNSVLTGENFIPETGRDCQDFVIELLRHYIKEMKK